MDAAAERLELSYVLPAGAEGAQRLAESERLSRAVAEFEHKLVGVDIQRAMGSDGSVTLTVTVRGGADREHLERVWRDHLAEHGLPAEGTTARRDLEDVH